MTLSYFKQWLISSASIVAWACICLWAGPSPLKVIISSVFLLLLPGYIILKLLHHQTLKFWHTLAYAAGLSVVFLMLAGLIINTALPLAGITHPLTTTPLTISIATMLLGLNTVLGLKRRSLLPALRLPHLSRTDKKMVLLGLLLPCLAVLGATSLNNSGTNAFAIGMLGLAAVYMVALAWPRHRFDRLHAFGLFMLSLAMLLATSLRGWNITGHDIIQEYQVFQLTASHGLWSIQFLQDAYNACLSITILPTILAALTGLDDPYVYKLLFQILFALMPVIIYLTLSRYTRRTTAFLAALVFISFPTFMLDMPMLGRQEIAFLCFALAFMALFDHRLARAPKTALVLLFLTGMIISHYSTSYIAVGAIVAAKLFELGFVGWRKLRRQSIPSRVWMPLGWTATAILICLVYAWNVPITNTGGSFIQTIANVVTNLPAVMQRDNETTKPGFAASDDASADQAFARYQATIIKTRDLPAGDYYPEDQTDGHPPVRAKETLTPLTATGQSLSQKLSTPLYTIYERVRTKYALLLQGLIVFGLIVLVIRLRFIRLPWQYVSLGAAFLAIIALQVLLPSTLVDYGLLRLIQQGLIFLALPVVAASLVITGWLRLPERYRHRPTALMFAGFFVVLSGLGPAITGGYKPSLQTSNSGFYYEAYYTHADEIAGFTWLKNQSPTGSIVNADEFARRKMITYAGIYARPSMAASAIAKDAYVYLSHSNTTTGKLPLYIEGTLLYQAVPIPFLNDTKDTIYAGGAVRIYK